MIVILDSVYQLNNGFSIKNKTKLGKMLLLLVEQYSSIGDMVNVKHLVFNRITFLNSYKEASKVYVCVCV